MLLISCESVESRHLTKYDGGQSRENRIYVDGFQQVGDGHDVFWHGFLPAGAIFYSRIEYVLPSALWEKNIIATAAAVASAATTTTTTTKATTTTTGTSLVANDAFYSHGSGAIFARGGEGVRIGIVLEART